MRGFHRCKAFLRNGRSAPQGSKAAQVRSDQKVGSKRLLHSNERLQNNFQIARTAISFEASSLRYSSFLFSSAEDSLPRGWDDDLIVNEDDGT
mmetsp:Transcript_19449/g.24494  ORF Transcript_19449/g.24494 Transcript_19449/m.24494 type:complete len:93 (+) Transcript_19449:126-404(+)